MSHESNGAPLDKVPRKSPSYPHPQVLHLSSLLSLNLHLRAGRSRTCHRPRRSPRDEGVMLFDQSVCGIEDVGLAAVEFALDALDDKIIPLDTVDTFQSANDQLLPLWIVGVDEQSAFSRLHIPRLVQPIRPADIVRPT